MLMDEFLFLAGLALHLANFTKHPYRHCERRLASKRKADETNDPAINVILLSNKSLTCAHSQNTPECIYPKVLL